MADGFVQNAARESGAEDRRLGGVTIARVVANCDESDLGRVQVHLPWLPGYEPVARIATMDQGTYFIPKVGDEVLVAFNHGDVRDAYVIGCLWNQQDKPPQGTANSTKTDPVNKRIIQTPKKHIIEFNDEAGTITIVNEGKQRITLGPSAIAIATENDESKITLTDTGEITIKAQKKITLDAPNVEIKGNQLEVKNTAKTKIQGGAACEIDAATISIG